MYMPGSLFIVRARGAEVDAIADIMLDDMVYPNYKSCRGETVLIYSFGLPDVTREMDGIVSGRIPLIEKFSKRLGVETLESFSFDYDQGRLSEYCRADAELCDGLMELNPLNDGRGMCSEALVKCGIDKGTSRYQAVLDKCMKAPGVLLNCLMVFDDTDDVYDACVARVRQYLCARPDH